MRTVHCQTSHESKIHYETYLTVVVAANEAFQRAVSFLDNLAKRDPQCDSLAFNIYETLIRETWERTKAIVEEEIFNAWCPKGRNTLYNFLEELTDYLTAVEQPFSTSVEALARWDHGLRNNLAHLARQSCCNVNPYRNLPHERHFLLNQLLILSPDPGAHAPSQDSSPENTSTCETYMINDTLKDEPRYRKCLRASCPAGQIHEAGDAEPLMTCRECGFRMCYVHSTPWHEGKTCSQYEARKRHKIENDSSMRLIDEVSKRCPRRKCNVPIEKNRGCDHMTYEATPAGTSSAGNVLRPTDRSETLATKVTDHPVAITARICLLERCYSRSDHFSKNLSSLLNAHVVDS
ncbi:hypothetical protein G7Y79_00013g034390 [Physcia stellaris]|nr:hypothetical protein G7Y79_00013g034390 [Physcia stellaris]